MQSETYEFSSYDEAIKILQSLKREGKDGKVIVFTINFDKNEESKKVVSPDEGCALVRRSQTIIINEDTYIPHMQLFSKKQSDIENIIRQGTMHDIIFGHPFLN